MCAGTRFALVSGLRRLFQASAVQVFPQRLRRQFSPSACGANLPQRLRRVVVRGRR